MNVLKVLYALNCNNELITPDDATKEEKYHCPSCETNLVFRKGTVKIPHFAHANTITCNQETITHKTAKLLIQKIITEWKAGIGKRPSMQRVCCVCGKEHTLKVPNIVEMATLEHRLSEGYIVDVALMVEGRVKAAVEVKVTHKVDNEKAKRLSLPFIEMEGEKIIENPYEWIPITDGFKKSACLNCKKEHFDFKRKAEQISSSTKIPLPEDNYSYFITSCGKCHKEILAFDWENRGNPNHGKHIPFSPKPETIQYKYIEYSKIERWVNACPYCKSIQNEWNLFGREHGSLYSNEFIKRKRLINYFENGKKWPYGEYQFTKNDKKEYRAKKQQEKNKEKEYIAKFIEELDKEESHKERERMIKIFYR